MTTFASLVADVYTTTNRPDLVAETALAVRKATLKLHTTGIDLETGTPKVVFYWPDRSEAIVTPTVVDLANNYYSFDTQAAPFSRFRALQYVRQYTPADTDLFFDPIDFDNLLDSYRIEKTNVFYLIGQLAQIRANFTVTQVRVGYYRYPVAIESGYSSWIADQLPDMVVEEAAATIFKMIGKDDEFQKYAALTKENMAALEGQFTTQTVRT